jgi:hypothetical protein
VVNVNRGTRLYKTLSPEGMVVSSLIVNLINELRVAMTRDDQRDIWTNPGTRELDAAIEVIADYYIDYPSERDSIRNAHTLRRHRLINE